MLKIISGGQTGADRAALDWAMANGHPHGGWCPRGRLAENGRIPETYVLVETPETEYAQRTEWNVRDSDGTVICSLAPNLSGGSQQTREFAEQQGKPWLHLSLEKDGEAAAGRLAQFIRAQNITVLNVAGPRSSSEPHVGAFVKSVLTGALGGVGPGK